MGNVWERSNADEDEEPVFVIPRSIYFTPSQMVAMVDAGQQPGVPFRVGNEGAQRPSRPMHQSYVVSNMASVDKNSFSMEIDESGRFIVSFVYDALVTVSLYIHFGARDSKSSKDVSPSSQLLLWGPFSLEPGIKRRWSSVDESLFGDPKFIVCGAGEIFDAVVILDRSLPSGSLGSPRGQYGDGDESAKGGHREWSRFLPVRLPGTAKGDGVQSSSDDHLSGSLSEGKGSRLKRVENAEGVSRHASYFIVKPTPTSFVRVRRKSSSSNKENAEVAVSRSRKHRHRHRNQESREHGVMGAEEEDTTTSPMSIAVKRKYIGKLSVVCAQQKIQLRQGGVFVVQNLYGMDRNDEEGDKTGVDTDASECVICLTEAKEVVVYPCRHMCMCMSCAEALPSQNNNCPICRRPVTLLLRLHAQEGGADAYRDEKCPQDSNAMGGNGMQTALRSEESSSHTL